MKQYDFDVFTGYAINAIDDAKTLVGMLRSFDMLYQPRLIVHQRIKRSIEGLDIVAENHHLVRVLYSAIGELHGDVSKKRRQELYDEMVQAREEWAKDVMDPLYDLFNMRILRARPDDRKFIDTMRNLSREVSNELWEAMQYVMVIK